MLEGMNRKYNISGIVAVLGVILLCGTLAKLLYSEVPFGKDKMNVAKEYIEMGAGSTGAQNMVTSVVLSFRALDTLGEVTVLFASSMAVGLLLLPGGVMWRRKENFVLAFATKWMPYLIGLIGIYIVLQGHLTPGGGFQGGVIIATGIMLYFLLSGIEIKKDRLVHILESIMGAGFVGIGLWGLYKNGSFLYNFLPQGKVGELFSAGILPVLYILIGIKVASEFTAILARFTSKDEE